MDGTRYGADKGELWCSEFCDRSLPGSSDGAPSNVSSVLSFFSGYLSRVYSPSHNRPEKAKRGDYLALDTNGDGSPNHSAMFLAFDHARGKMWTLKATPVA